MSALPHNAKTVDLLKWVAANPNQPFDPNMVVSSTHTSDWEWQAVLGQMEDLRRQGYILKLNQSPFGSTYWTITNSGSNYLRALESFEGPHAEVAGIQKVEVAVELPIPHSVPAVVASEEPPVPTPKKYLWPFMERMALRIRHIINWEDMPTHLAAQLTYDLLKYSVLLVGALLVGGVSFAAYHLIHFLISRALIR